MAFGYLLPLADLMLARLPSPCAPTFRRHLLIANHPRSLHLLLPLSLPSFPSTLFSTLSLSPFTTWPAVDHASMSLARKPITIILEPRPRGQRFSPSEISRRFSKKGEEEEDKWWNRKEKARSRGSRPVPREETGEGKNRRRWWIGFQERERDSGASH